MIITINNSISKIEDMSYEAQKSLIEVLAYSVYAYYTGGWNRKKCLINKRGEFPTGLLSRVVKHLKNNGFKFTIDDLRRPPLAVNHYFKPVKGIVPYSEQKSIVEACREANRGTVSAVTGFGKSIAMMMLVEAMQLKTLIVVPNLTLKAQLQASFKSYFGSLSNIAICNIDSPELKSFNHFDMLIIDEAHHVAASTYRKLNVKYWNNIFLRFFFTATPFRSKSEEQLLFESIAGEVIYEIDYKKAVDKGYIVPVEAYYIDLPKTPNDCITYQEAYNKLIVNNKLRNYKIASLIHNLQESGNSTLCLVKEIAHGNAIKALTSVEFANGESEDSRRLILEFALNERKCLIGTNGMLGEGVDTKPAEYIIIVGLGKSKNAFMQQVGRGLRKFVNKESCKIILFRDPSNKYTLRHFKEQCKILKQEYGVTPIKL